MTNFLDLIGKENHDLLKAVKIACIGPITAKTAEDNGLIPHILPQQFTIEALVDAIEEYCSSEKKNQ